MHLADSDVVQGYKDGTHFNGFEERVKSKIVSILSESPALSWNESLGKIRQDCQQMIGKEVSVVSRD